MKKKSIKEQLKTANTVHEYRMIFENMVLENINVDKFIIKSLSTDFINDKEKYNDIKRVWFNLKYTINNECKTKIKNSNNYTYKIEKNNLDSILEFRKKSFKEQMKTLLQLKIKNNDIEYLTIDMIKGEDIGNALYLEIIKLTRASIIILEKRSKINELSLLERIKEIKMNSCMIFYIDNPTKNEVDLALEINPSLKKYYFEESYNMHEVESKEKIIDSQTTDGVPHKNDSFNSYITKNYSIEDNKTNKENLITQGKEVLKENIKLKENYEISDNVNRKSLVINRIKRNINVDENLTPSRKSVEINKVIRNYSVVKYLKELYENRCQVCGIQLEIGMGNFYSEVHHIRPLGKHVGSDTINNTIVLCPNCHTLFDKGSIMIDEITMEVKSINKDNYLNGKRIEFKHNINIDNLIYHNKHIYVLDYICSDIESKYIEVKKVDYEDSVMIYDSSEKNVLIINMNAFWQGDSLPLIQKKLLNKKVGDEVEVNGYKYKIIEIEEI